MTFPIPAHCSILLTQAHRNFFCLSFDGIGPAVCSYSELILEPRVLQLGQFCRTVLLRTQYIATQGNAVLTFAFCKTNPLSRIWAVHNRSTFPSCGAASVDSRDRNCDVKHDAVIRNFLVLSCSTLPWAVIRISGPVSSHYTIYGVGEGGAQAGTNFEITRTK
jgi:hypothetical protein